MRNAVIDTALSYVKRWGACDFTTDGSFNGGAETQIALNFGAVPVSGIPLYYNKIVSNVFVEMTAGEKTAVDAGIPKKDTLLDSFTLAENTLAVPGAWGVLSGVVFDPSVYNDGDLSDLFLRVSCEYSSDVTGGTPQLRLQEDAVSLQTQNLSDTAGGFNTLSFDTTPGSLTTGAHAYVLQGQLNGGASASVRFATLFVMKQTVAP